MTDIGDVLRLKATFYDSNNVAVDPNTITLAIKNSTGTTVYTYGAAEIAKEATGVYYRDVTLDVAGWWFYRWTATGTPTTSEERRFHVRSRWVS